MLDGFTSEGAGLPLFSILGTCRAAGGMPRYFIRVNSEVRWYRGWEVGSVPFLLDLLPDHEHWRSQFPRVGNRRIDVQAARVAFVRMFAAAGPYDPPPELRPRRNGRPRKTP